MSMLDAQNRIRAARVLNAATGVSYLSSEFVEAVKYWVMPRTSTDRHGPNADWGPRMKAYDIIKGAGVPAKYRTAGALYRGLTLKYLDWLKMKGKYKHLYPSSWSTEPIKKTAKGIGFGTEELRHMDVVKKGQKVPDDQVEFARVFVIIEHRFAPKDIVLNIHDLFLDPEYKQQLKESLGAKVKLTDTLFRKGWMNEVIIKPGVTTAPSDIIFERFFTYGISDERVKQFRREYGGEV